MSALKTCMPAFPFVAVDPTGQCEPNIAEGMTLRDYFAAKAITAVWQCYENGGIEPLVDEDAEEAIARVSYAMADAMLKARQA